MFEQLKSGEVISAVVVAVLVAWAIVWAWHSRRRIEKTRLSRLDQLIGDDGCGVDDWRELVPPEYRTEGTLHFLKTRSKPPEDPIYFNPGRASFEHHA